MVDNSRGLLLGRRKGRQMSDLITRDEALKAIVDERTHTLLQAWINIKNTVPSVDAVEVVRCKECRHWCNHKDADYDQSEFTYYCEVHGISLTGNDFCSYGERRTDG